MCMNFDSLLICMLCFIAIQFEGEIDFKCFYDKLVGADSFTEVLFYSFKSLDCFKINFGLKIIYKEIKMLVKIECLKN